MVQKLLEYITKKIKDLDITQSDTKSVYIKLTGRKIRISDHLGLYNDKIDVSVLISEDPTKFVVSIGHKIYIYNTLRQTGDLVINYILFNRNIFKPYRENVSKLIKDRHNQFSLEKTEEIRKIKEEHIEKDRQFSGMVKKVKLVEKENKSLSKERILLINAINDKNIAIKEAAEIIEDLTTNPEARQMIYSEQSGKKYYLDNFSDEAREMVEEIIKEYYSK